MNENQKTQIEQYLERIARQEGLTTEEVRKDIGLAISYALKSDDPKVQNFWKAIPCKGAAPTIEEIIDYMTIQLANQSK